MTTSSPPLTPDQRHFASVVPISDFALASRPSFTAAEREKRSWAQIVSAINAALLIKHSMAGLVRRSARMADFWWMASAHVHLVRSNRSTELATHGPSLTVHLV
ncbi:uncharacterized protein N7458_002932 [Penicillium daleae]|uniref:Uncharacterized protein n=1 Tax=Penicillium daleae TaxID=63821 RepID=A0AAD6G7A1_9EURO|nr:uncharacterized protein N7458_002932 [Penicillium daleae]KAJ5461380.1 hypothetical protein N7458_002932 [Penicillium daleae]